ncbi:MAG: STAS domain-containing protein [Synechocystis sp.]|nr:STAS domain-containing protein [Synechocystis sp.]
MPLKIQVIEPNDIFDGEQAGKYYQEIERMIASKITMIVIDFKNVTFMDSSGLGTLVQYLKMTRDAQTRLLLCSLNQQIFMLFELTGMDRVFEVFTGREELEQRIMTSHQ